MKTVLALLIVVSIGCGSYRSGQPATTSANKNDTFTPRSSSPASSAAELNAPSSESPQPQTQESELWDPNDDLHVADKMLERVKQEGAIRIVSVHPSTDKYVFVAEVEGEREGGSAQDSTPKTDLWLVNKNGTGLRRLTDDKKSHDPVWSLSGEEIAFISNGSVRIIADDSNKADPWSCGSATPTGEDVHVEYSRPTFSPNGKAIAVLAKDGAKSWVEVTARSNRGGGEAPLAKGFERYEWNSESELVLGTGRLVFDWEHLGSDTETSADSAALTADKAGDGQSSLPPELLKRLLRKLSAHGVMKIGACAISPSGHRIVLEGVFDESPQYAGGPPTKDLWLVNRDGSRLRRLTQDNVSYAPVWSPSGKEIAFTAFGFYSSVGIIDVRTQKVRWLSGLQALSPGAQGTHARRNWGYDGPRWSLDGKVIAAVGRDGEGDDWITVVDARSGNKLFQTNGGGYSFSWNHDGELVISALGKFVFDWSSRIFNRH